MTSKIVVNNVGADAGIASVHFDSNIQRGTSNLHSTGLNVSDTFLHSTGLNVGTGATIHQPADNVMTLGTNGSERLRITSDGDVAITTRGTVEGVSKLNVEIPSRTTAFSASDGDTWHDILIENPGSATTNAIGLCFQVTGDSYHKNAGTGIAAVKNGTASDYGADLVFITRPQSAVAQERLRIGSAGQIGIGGANYGTSGQVLTSAGSGSAVQWASASNPTLAHAFVNMDSQYFTSSVTLLEFNNSTTNDKSSGVTITRGGSERFTPTVAGTYFVQAHLTFSHGGGTYTPVVYIYRNGSSYVSANNIVNYGGGHNDSLSCQAMVTMNGSSDYVDMRGSHNGGGNATMSTISSFAMFRVGA